MPETLGKLWLLISMVLGIIFIPAMTRVYQIETVPTVYWVYDSRLFPDCIPRRPTVCRTPVPASRVPFNSTIFSSISLLALLVCIAVIALQGMALASIHSSVQQASSLIPDYAVLQVCRVALLVIGWAAGSAHWYVAKSHILLGYYWVLSRCLAAKF